MTNPWFRTLNEQLYYSTYYGENFILRLWVAMSVTEMLLWKVEPRSHFKSRLSLIVQANVVLRRTVVVDSDWHFDNLRGSHLQSQSESYHVSWWYYTLVIDLIGQLRRDVIGRLSVKMSVS